MSDKKHIDKLFQEKLSNLEATPNASVWEGISRELEADQKERKAIPLWWKLAAVAAGFIIIITIGNMVINNVSEENPEIEIVDQDNPENQQVPTAEDELANPQNIGSEKENGEIDKTEKQLVDTGDSESNPKQSESVADQGTERQSLQPLPKQEEVVASNSKNDAGTKTIGNDEKQQAVDNNLKNDEAVVSNTNNKLNDNKAADSGKIDSDKKQNLNEVSDAAEKLANTEIADAKTEEKKNELVEDKKESLIDAVAKVEEQTEEDEEEKEESEALERRWSVAPNVAPVYFNSLGNGSSIDSQFDGNDKSGELNMSYGVSASYALNNKLRVRAGINRVNIGYSTNDVIIYNNVDPVVTEKPLRNVDLNEANQNLSFLSANDLIAQVPGVVAQNIQSSIDQELGFLEIPVELEYKISDKKLDLTLIGGMSTLFLNENNVYSSLQGQRTLLGEANNINETSFTANLGLGLNYEVSERINLNLEPVFKYQLNTFRDTSGDFNPYILGIYTGFSFKF